MSVKATSVLRQSQQNRLKIAKHAQNLPSFTRLRWMEFANFGLEVKYDDPLPDDCDD